MPQEPFLLRALRVRLLQQLARSRSWSWRTWRGSVCWPGSGWRWCSTTCPQRLWQVRGTRRGRLSLPLGRWLVPELSVVVWVRKQQFSDPETNPGAGRGCSVRLPRV